MKTSILRCPYQNQCSGCEYLHLDLEQQKQAKIESLKSLAKGPVNYRSFGLQELRSRLDFVILNGKIGLYQKNSSEVVDIEKCLQLSPALQSFLSDFRKIRWPVKKASVRLRVSPQGKRGAWLDFANADIKRLLEEETIFTQLQQICFVEIGQRHKALIRKPQTGNWGLGDPQYHHWSNSWCVDQEVPLFSTVGSFTQPSHVSNQLITQTLSKWFSEIKPEHVLEFGSGIGNLTFPALTHSKTQVTATDWDERALKGLEQSLIHQDLQVNMKSQTLRSRVDIQRGDFRLNLPRIERVDVLLLNPARSGVGNFLKSLLPLKPQHIIYMSCFPESFFLDTQCLNEYSMQKIELMDQFPNTKHIEILSHWVRL